MSRYELRLLDGDQYFEALFEAIGRARREILFESYIFESDSVGERIANVLSAASRRGVKVKLLVDDLGSSGLTVRMIEHMRLAKVDVHVFRPVWKTIFLLRNRFQGRNHRKVVVIDAQEAFVGGINVWAEQMTEGGRPARYDYATWVKGDVVAEIHASVTDVIAQVSKQNQKGTFERAIRFMRAASRSRKAMRNPFGVGEDVFFVPRDNARNRHLIEAVHRHVLNEARQEVIIANSYFLPGRTLRTALKAAAQRGVRVVLLLQGRVDVFIVHFATQRLYRSLLSAGIEIYEYQPTYLHAKVAVVDEAWSTVGSCNLDPTSLLMNLEANLVITDRAFCAELRTRLWEQIEKHSMRITPEAVKHVSWRWAAVSWFCYFLLRLFADRILSKRNRPYF